MIIYNGPIGEEVINPSEDFLQDIFFKKEEDYWKQGSGDSCIEISECEERIIFFYDSPYGFFVMRHPDYLVKINKEMKIKKTEHIVGGEPMSIPTCAYLSREDAYYIIKYFIEKNGFYGEKDWIDLYDIEFDDSFDT